MKKSKSIHELFNERLIDLLTNIGKLYKTLKITAISHFDALDDSNNLFSLCKKTPITALLSFLNQSFTKRKLLEFKNFESLVFDVFLSKSQKKVVFLQGLFNFVPLGAFLG